MCTTEGGLGKDTGGGEVKAPTGQHLTLDGGDRSPPPLAAKDYPLREGGLSGAKFHQLGHQLEGCKQGGEAGKDCQASTAAAWFILNLLSFLLQV